MCCVHTQRELHTIRRCSGNYRRFKCLYKQLSRTIVGALLGKWFKTTNQFTLNYRNMNIMIRRYPQLI
jgi:hypothetical protein